MKIKRVINDEGWDIELDPDELREAYLEYQNNKACEALQVILKTKYGHIPYSTVVQIIDNIEDLADSYASAYAEAISYADIDFDQYAVEIINEYIKGLTKEEG